MKNLLTIVLACFLIIGFLEQSNGQNLTSQQKSKIEKEVDSVFHSMIKAAESLNYDKLSTGVDDRYNAGFIVNSVYFPTYDSLARIMKANTQDGASQSIKIQKEKITVLSDRIALLTASGNAKVEINPYQTFSTKFLWSFVYEKIGNEWKVVQSHQSRAD